MLLHANINALNYLKKRKYAWGLNNLLTSLHKTKTCLSSEIYCQYRGCLSPNARVHRLDYTTQRTDVMITPVFRQNVVTSFWLNNGVIFTPCVPWAETRIPKSQMNVTYEKHIPDTD